MSKKRKERKNQAVEPWMRFVLLIAFGFFLFHASHTLILVRSPPAAPEAKDTQQRRFRQTQEFFFYPLTGKTNKHVFRWQLPLIYFLAKSDWNQTSSLNAIYHRLNDYKAVGWEGQVHSCWLLGYCLFFSLSMFHRTHCSCLSDM